MDLPNMSGPLKIYPTIEECQINNRVTCPVKECSLIFTSESNLNLHLTKTHKRMPVSSSPVEKQFFCPKASCPWNNSKHFKNMKNLRQHFLKVHAEKQFSCFLCQKSYPTSALLQNHSKFCNVTFTCLDCKASYDCYETLRTHCRRKQHRILHKNEYTKQCTVLVNTVSVQPGEKLILPLDDSVIVEVTDQNSQTSPEKPLLKSKMTQVRHENEFVVVQASQQTQTGCKSSFLSVETQTIGDFPNVKTKTEIPEENYKHINTQTDAVQSRDSSCNTSFDIGEFEESFNNYIERANTSTQTQWPEQNLFDISTATHDIHTDTSDLLSESLSSFETNFYNCHMETQTDLMFESEMFNSDYYANMYTQTCDEILSGFPGFNDCQTQTAFKDTLRSVESQTLMSRTEKLCPNVLKDIVHTETQTDAEFREMLEIINS